MICCGGVLHHLPDPAAGLRALRSVLKQGGVLQLATYSTIGTSAWRKVREKKQTAFWGPCRFPRGENDHFAKTGSGQNRTQGNTTTTLKRRCLFN